MQIILCKFFSDLQNPKIKLATKCAKMVETERKGLILGPLPLLEPETKKVFNKDDKRTNKKKI